MTNIRTDDWLNHLRLLANVYPTYSLCDLISIACVRSTGHTDIARVSDEQLKLGVDYMLGHNPPWLS